MKIFNWVHRRFKDGMPQNAKENGGAVMADTEQAAGMESKAFGCWKGGILTIGTFGYDPLMKSSGAGDDHVMMLHNDGTLEVDDEHEKLVVEVAIKTGIAVNDEKREIKGEESSEDEALDYVVLEDKETMTSMDDEYSKQRITLADLFSADSEEEDPAAPPRSSKMVMMSAKTKANSGGEWMKDEKKLGDNPKKKAPAIQKLHRMMKRMLKKKKIHPSSSSSSSGEVASKEEVHLPPQSMNYYKVESAPLLP